MIQDMSTEQFFAGTQTIYSPTWKPSEITSDNASQFKLASETIHKLWTHIVSEPEVASYVANEGIQWTFIVELAPWMGGFYERLVGW